MTLKGALLCAAALSGSLDRPPGIASWHVCKLIHDVGQCFSALRCNGPCPCTLSLYHDTTQ